MRTRTKLLVLGLIGVFIREIFAPFTGHPYDFELWVRLGYYVSKGLDPFIQRSPVPGLSFPASENPSWPGYPPLWPLFVAMIYKFYILVGVQDRFLYYFLLKQPMIAADVIDAWLISKLVGLLSTKDKAVKAFEFWILCPYTILISSIWGMFDQIILAFILLALITMTRPIRSAFFESIGIALKLIPSIYLPLFVALQSSREKKILYAVAVILLSAFFSLFPYLFFRSWSLPALIGVGVNVLDKFGNTLNYWEALLSYWILTNYSVPNSVFLILSVIGLIWIPSVLVATYFCVKSIHRGKKNLELALPISALCITLVFFLTKFVITEQFLIYFLGFGVIDYFVISNSSRRMLFTAIWVTAFVEIFVNDAFGLEFLDPISIRFFELSNYFLQGPFDILRLILMAALGVVFSLLSLAYLYSLYKELGR